MLLWHTLATYFRRKYGVRVQKIPLDAGATCPNRDGTLSARGCIFCNDSGSGSGMGLRGLDLRAQWDAWYTKYTTTDSDRLFMAYLQSFSNTYGPASRLAHLLEQVAAHLEERREIAVDVQVKAPEVRTVDVSVQVAARPGADFNTVRQAVESAVRGWFDGRLLGQSVLRAQLGALIFGVEGVENYALTAPAADVAAAVDELPQLGTLTVAALEGTA